MAAIQVDGKSGKKALDHEVPLIPFIDLLLCCVMFLLATAVWTQLASMNANQQVEGGTTEDVVTHPGDRLVLQVQRDGFVLASTLGDRVEIPADEGGYDHAELRSRLEQRRQLQPNDQSIVVAPEDGVQYEHVIEAMDTITGAGFSELSLADGSLM